jgi:glutamate formiminotransferase/formiminotetrahydrofolate cyclodeaminase
MESLLTLPARDLLDAFAAPTPTPGGGSAAALAGALGASLLLMVARMPRTRTGADAERAGLDAASAALLPLRDRLAALVDEDTAAYGAVMAAFKRPKGTAEEMAARKAAIQSATRRATETPLHVMAATADALEAAATVATHGNANAASDVRVAVSLLSAACAGARENVLINLPGLGDAVRPALAADAERVRSSAEAAAVAAIAALA